MRHEIHFNFDGQWSYDMGIIKASLNSGLFEDQIVSSKSIIEEKIDGRKKPYFYGVQYEPLSFPLPIVFENNLSSDKIREILRWLNKDKYCPFYMVDNPERIWYAMVIDDIRSIHNGIKSGYMELQLRTDDVHTLTPSVLSKSYVFKDNVNGKVIEFENIGDFECKPIVHITKLGHGNITIKNLSNETGDFTFENINDKEELRVDCENKEIDTSETVYRYNNFSGNYLSLVCGVNRLKVIGDCEIRFETEFKVY